MWRTFQLGSVHLSLIVGLYACQYCVPVYSTCINRTRSKNEILYLRDHLNHRSKSTNGPFVQFVTGFSWHYSNAPIRERLTCPLPDPCQMVDHLCLLLWKDVQISCSRFNKRGKCSLFVWTSCYLSSFLFLFSLFALSMPELFLGLLDPCVMHYLELPNDHLRILLHLEVAWCKQLTHLMNYSRIVSLVMVY